MYMYVFYIFIYFIIFTLYGPDVLCPEESLN